MNTDMGLVDLWLVNLLGWLCLVVLGFFESYSKSTIPKVGLGTSPICLVI